MAPMNGLQDPANIIDNAPKQINAAVWVVACTLIVAGGAIGIWEAIESRSALAAQTATAPLAERVKALEQTQQATTEKLFDKLNEITTHISTMDTNIAVLTTQMNDAKQQQGHGK